MSSHPLRAIHQVTLANPFREVENSFWELFARPAGSPPQVPEIKLDITEDDKAYHIKAEVPGVRKDDLKVKVEGNRVSIAAEVRSDEEKKKGERVIFSERATSQLFRAFTLPHDVDGAKAEARCQEGILDLTLPKKPGETQTEVKVQ